jgi:hypothetical protein
LKFKIAALNEIRHVRAEHITKVGDYSPEEIERVFALHKRMILGLAEVYHVMEKNGHTLTVQYEDMTPATWKQPMASGNSSYDPLTHTITLRGKFSIITSLHEFGHARGFDEEDTVIWSVNIFKRLFPNSFIKLVGADHMMIQQIPPGTAEQLQEREQEKRSLRNGRHWNGDHYNN